MFSAYDLQCSQYFHTGRNSDTKNQCEIDIVGFLLEGEYADDEIDKAITSPEERQQILIAYEVRIDEHEEIIDED